MSRLVAERVDRLAEQVAAMTRVSLLAIGLDLPECPSWAEPLDGTRCVRIIGGQKADRRRVVTALRKGQSPEGCVRLEYRPGASRFIAEAVSGPASEVAGWGARGDRKTSAALAAVIILADLHREAGGALPMRFMVPTGSHVEHELKLCRSVIAPHWSGMWSLREDKHLAVLTIDGVELAHLDLFGTSDPGALDRMRMEAHALWVEEAAPAALEGGGGVTEDAYSMSLPSCRLPTPRRVALLTSNMPDEDFWAWQRFEVQRHPGTVSVRIPAGESASAEDRARWAVALQHRPDLLARLLNGEPGSVVQGPQVAKGYNALTHVAPDPRPIVRGGELWFGWDSAPNAHTHATIVGQWVDGELCVYAGLVSEETGLKQHLEVTVLPWLARRAPWVLTPAGRERCFHRYDPAMDTDEGGDIDMNPVARIRRSLGGSFRAGAVDWAGRSGPLLAALNMGNGRGGMALRIDPGEDTALLRQALGSRWHYSVTRSGTVIRDLPAKPNHPFEDLGDALCYVIGGMAPSRGESEGSRRTTAYIAGHRFNPMGPTLASRRGPEPITNPFPKNRRPR
jgi:hypothetical protein